MGKSASNAFQAHIVDVAEEVEGLSELTAKAGNKDTFLDAEAKNAARLIGQHALGVASSDLGL